MSYLNVRRLVIFPVQKFINSLHWQTTVTAARFSRAHPATWPATGTVLQSLKVLNLSCFLVAQRTSVKHGSLCHAAVDIVVSRLRQ